VFFPLPVFKGCLDVLIARVIADHAQLESGFDAFKRSLSDAGMVAPQYEVQNAGQSKLIEVTLGSGDQAAVRSLIDQHFAPQAYLISDHLPRAPKLFVSDMDSTMIGQECIDELADYAGLKDQVAHITELAMRGELDFASALEQRVALLEGLEESAIDACLAERIRPEPGARELVQTLKKAGAKCVLVTGGFHHFADAVAQQLGFDRVVGNRLQVKDGRLTGKLDGPISDAATKLATLRSEASSLAQLDGEEPIRVLASGDGANDIPMLQAADYGFAYNAKPIAQGAANGVVTAGGLRDILRLLDIAESD
jgi:phosphoserine phosphatase